MVAMPQHERLDGFDAHADGSVTLHSSDPEGYATGIRLSAAEVARVAEASAVAYRVRLVPCQRCHIERPASDINLHGLCDTCVISH